MPCTFFMKNHLHRLILFTLVISGLFTACRKGDGDPVFSFRTRTGRLAGDWKVKYFAESIKYRNTEHFTSIEGNKKKIIHKVDSSVIVLLPYPHDSLITFASLQTFTGDALWTIQKSGTWTITETFSNDSIPVAATDEMQGLWYFQGPNRDAGYKNKELLGMATTSHTHSSSDGISYSIQTAGNPEMIFYEIYSLKHNEIVLLINKLETIGGIEYNTRSETTLIPR